MLKHYLTIALRLLQKQRLYATINIVGLSIALGLVALIALFVQDEFTFDDWHQNVDRIMRVDRVNFNPDGTPDGQGPWMPYPFAEALVRDHPMVESAIRMFDTDVVIRVEQHAIEETVLFVDSTFLDAFTYKVLQGNPSTALVDPSSIVLTETAARRHFNSIDVVGRSLEMRFEDSYENAVVTAVLRDPPSNTNIPFEYLLPFHRLPIVYPWIANRVDRWNASSFNVFAVLREDADIVDAQATLGTLWRKYFPDRIASMREDGSWSGAGDPASYKFIPIKELHLDTSTPGSFVANSNPVYSLILIAIGLTILALACINFVILSIGRSATRSSEIGVRKAMGAQRNQLIAQFGSESILLSLLALVVGLVLSILLLPTFNSLSGKHLSPTLASDFPVLLALVVAAILTGIIAGWYPSLVISRYRAADSLRGRFGLGGSSPLTKTLVVAQFAASIILVAGSLVMNQQMSLVQTRDLGYDPGNVLVVHANGKDGRELTRHLERTLGDRTDINGIAAISFSMNRGYSQEGWRVGDEDRLAYVYNIEPEVLDVLDVDVIAGRALDDRFASDSTYGALINEAFAAQIGLTPEDAVGTRIAGYGDSPPYIVGVVRNLNFRSLREEVAPMILTMDQTSNMHYSLIRVNGTNYGDVIDALGTSWASFAPDIPLEYTFLDADVAMTYENDRRWSRVVQYSAGVAILIACMGLFGLAALTIARRTKEIGVRKVLGASVPGILLLVTRDFARLVVIATVLAGPLAYLALTRWLEGFAYHVNPSVWVFLGAGATVLILALGTVTYHALRAAMGNPVDALRYE